VRSDRFSIEPLAKAHDRSAFSCGSESLDRYLRHQASQDVAKYVAACFVATPDGARIAGFYTLSQYSVHLASLPDDIARKLPRYPDVPATLLGRLAVDQSFRGRGLGELLLMDALRRSLQQSRHIASSAVIVDAKDEPARRFYLHFHFLPIPGNQSRLFLPMSLIAKLWPSP
jgi:GNAT superfamily N-acetyltransferase